MAMEMSINTVVPGVQGKPYMLLNVRSAQNDARQSLQAVLPEISGNKNVIAVRNRYAAISSLFLILQLRHYRHYLFQACLARGSSG